MIKDVTAFLALASQPESQTTTNVLRSVSTTEDVWLDVVRDHPDLRPLVAINRTIPESILRVLAADNEPRVRTLIASRRSLPVDVFELLSQDASDLVRGAVAHNQKAPLEVLERLSRDASVPVSKQALEQLKHRSTGRRS